MVVGSSLVSRGSSNTADLDPRAIGFQVADVDHIIPTGNMSAAMVERPLTSSSPPKKADLDEAVRLMKELEAMSQEKAQAEEMTDMMGQDLQFAQEDIEKKDEELVYLRKQVTQLESTIKEKDTELTTKVSLAAGAAYDKWQPIIREKQLQFETTLRETEERLNAQVTHEQELRRTAEATLHTTREEMRTTSNQEQMQDQQLRFETTLREMEERLQARLTQEQEQRRIAEETLHTTQEKLDTQSGQQEQELRHAAEASLRTTKEAFEVHLREASERTEALQRRVQDAEASLQEHKNYVQGAAIHQKNLIHRIHELESEVQNQRKACDFFKKNSERLSREIKQADAARRQLEHSEHVGKRQVADLKLQVEVLEQRQRRETMPG